MGGEKVWELFPGKNILNDFPPSVRLAHKTIQTSTDGKCRKGILRGHHCLMQSKDSKGVSWLRMKDANSDFL